ncbi:MAG: hypothetical protein R3D67_00150 [Hyphomicrobiaceae bacterium]
MQHPILLATAGALCLIGILLIRWAGRYDPAGIATDAAWRLVKRRSVTGARDELGRIVNEQLQDFHADASRIGNTRTAFKHGARFFVARFVNIAGYVLLLCGLLAGAAAVLWH